MQYLKTYHKTAFLYGKDNKNSKKKIKNWKKFEKNLNWKN